MEMEVEVEIRQQRKGKNFPGLAGMYVCKYVSINMYSYLKLKIKPKERSIDRY